MFSAGGVLTKSYGIHNQYQGGYYWTSSQDDGYPYVFTFGIYGASINIDKSKERLGNLGMFVRCVSDK